MPGPDYSEVARWMIESGFAPETPCLIISKATQIDQLEQRATLASLHSLDKLPAPALLLVGRVISHHESADAAFDWLREVAVEPAQLSRIS
jgi:uroporphyrin-III C-methyltransferase